MNSSFDSWSQFVTFIDVRSTITQEVVSQQLSSKGCREILELSQCNSSEIRQCLLESLGNIFLYAIHQRQRQNDLLSLNRIDRSYNEKKTVIVFRRLQFFWPASLNREKGTSVLKGTLDCETECLQAKYATLGMCYSSFSEKTTIQAIHLNAVLKVGG